MIILGIGAMFESYSQELDGELVTWNVDAIQAAAKSGMFGEPVIIPTCELHENAKYNIDRARVECIKQILLSGKLPDPIIVIVHSDANGELEAIALVNGNHRNAAFYELGIPTQRAYLVTPEQEKLFRVNKDNGYYFTVERT